MIQQLFDMNAFIYIMLGVCALGVLAKLILSQVYSGLVKASDNMSTSKNKLTLTMKKKFEYCYKLKIGVNNVDIFVDKYIFRHKICGILLSTWESICGQLVMVCVLIASISSILGIIEECGKQQILSTFSVGILTTGLLISLEGFLNLSGKKDIIRLNMKDYLENFLKVRLEQEISQPELVEQYKKELKAMEESGQLTDAFSFTAASLENKNKAIKKIKKEVIRKENKSIAESKHKKIEKKKNALLLKEEKKRKEQLRKEEIKRSKLTKKANKEKQKQEQKAAIAKKKEEERLAIERIKVEVKAEEERKKEEKRHKEEMKKMLELEKKVNKNNKKQQDSRTIAQEKKENLLREVNVRRSSIERNSSSEDMEGIHNNIEELELTNKEVESMEHMESITREVKERVALTTEKESFQLDKDTKIQLQNLLDKGIKKGTIAEDKLIEDILKEYLA